MSSVVILSLLSFLFFSVVLTVPIPNHVEIRDEVELENFKNLLQETELSRFAAAEHKKLLNAATDPDATRSVPEIIAAYGFPFEEHTVVTDDGYILKLHRIPQKNKTISSPRVVFLQHGLVDSSATFLMLKGQSLPFLLSNAEFDVWLGNSRGNVFSSQHQTIDPKSNEFWQFSWDQMALNDLPAVLKYIINVTKKPNLTYIGHSQGCTIAFALLSSKPETASYVNLFISLAPAPYLGNMRLPLLQKLAGLPPSVLTFLLGKQSFADSSANLPFSILCSLVPSLCHNVLCLLAGCNKTDSIPPSRVSTILAHFPAGTSVQNMVHYAQSVTGKKFERFDYGATVNQKVYNSPFPPAFDVKSFPVPTIIFYGSEDQLADDIDVRYLISLLPPPRFVKELSYGHGDFIWNDDAVQSIYAVIIKELTR